MFLSTKSIRITRASSLSSIGKRIDRDLTLPVSKPQANPIIPSLRRASSLTKLNHASKSKQKNAANPVKKDGEMKLKIKKEIDMLRAGTAKGKKLSLGTKQQSSQTISNQTLGESQQKLLKSVQGTPLTISNWKQLQKAVPSAGYLYIDCPHEAKPTSPSRTITLSKNWVMITEPQQQRLVRVEDYAQTLRKFECLERVQLFRKFLLIKTFRKWRIITEYSQLRLKRSMVQRQLEGVYREVYLQLVGLLDRVRLYKFVRSSNRSIPLEEYHEYLFNCSDKIMQELHDYVFVACLDAIFNPIRQLALALRTKAQSRTRKTSQESFKCVALQNIQGKYQQRIERVVVGKGEQHFWLLRSIQFRQSFMQFFPVLKKCLYIFHEGYVQWVKGCLLELIVKLQGSLLSWQRQKQRFGQILTDIISQHCQKYAYYSPDFTERDIGLVSYICQISQSRNIAFSASQEYLVSLFMQYAQFITKNISIKRMIQCYSRSRTSFQSQEQSPKMVELQLLQEVMRTNDSYNSQEILKAFPIEEQFRRRLKSCVAVNFAQVMQVIDFYNILLSGFFSCRQDYRTPSQIYEYLQAVKIKLLYLPRRVEVGLFALDFSAVHEYLSLQVAAMQTELFINVPSDFRQLFAGVHEMMDTSYRGIRNSMWTVDELLASYGFFEAYEEYRAGQLHEDLEKFKSCLQVISAKCPQHYHQSFMMLLNVKEMRDKLDIKTKIFTQRLPGRLKAFRGDIQMLKQDIWKSLYVEQSSVIALCKQTLPLLQILTGLKGSELNLRGIKQKMDKLQVIGRLQVEYFIEQELTVNTHSYIKMSNDVRLLLTFTQKFVDFQEKVKRLFPKKIFEVSSDEILGELRLNVAEIKEIYLLLIVYETVLRELLQKYEQWRQYLQTVDQISFLSAQQLAGVRRLKELNLHGRVGLTFEECFNINIHSVYQQIRQIKERKVKVSELQLIFTDLDALERQPPFQIRKARRQSRGTTRAVISGRTLDEVRNDKIKYEFDNFSNIYRSLQQFQNELKGLLSSPFLTDYKFEITLRVERLERAVKLLQEISEARGEYNSIMQVQLFEQQAQGEERRWQLSAQILAFFQNYRQQRQQVRQFWIKLVNGLSKRSLTDLLSANDDVDTLMRTLSGKMRNLRECVQLLVKKKRQEIYMLNLVDNSTVLAVVQYPSYYFQLFYSVREVRKPGAQLQLVTIYDQILTLHKSDNEKQAPIEINSFEVRIGNELRKLLAAHQSQHPIDNLLNYMALQLPLQIVYVLDQLYFADRYLSSDRASPQVLRSLQGEIRLICRNGLRQELDSAHVNYALALFDQLLASRIQLRTRVQHNPGSEIWYRNVLIFQLYENMLTLRNFNTQILSSFRLVDPSALALAFPFCEKALVKICNAMKFQESIVVQQTEIVASIAARTMSLFYRVNLTPSNTENVLFACQQLYPLFVVGFVSNLDRDLVLVFQELNKIERVNSLRTALSKDRRLLPSIFIHCEKSSAVQLSQTLKLRFRTVNAVSPCPEVILSTKMLNHDYIIDRTLFLNLVFLLRAYIILLREQKRYYISFQDLGLICDKVMRRLSLQPPEGNSQGMLLTLLKDYFQAIDYPLEKLLNNFVQGKNRADFERSPMYELAQNIIQGTARDLPIIQDSALQLRLKEYQSMKKSFLKYSQQLLSQKFDPAFVQKLGSLFELSFNLQNRPIAVIGPCQSGKNLLFKLFSEYLRETVGKGRLSWRSCDLQIFNAVLGTAITENEPIIQQFVNESEEKDLSWIVFEGFACEANLSLFQHIFSRMGQDVRLKSLPLGDSALSFCELYHCRQRYLERMHSLHNRYVGFKLESLRGVAPSYICSLSKVYLSGGTLSLAGVFQLKANEVFKDFVDRNEELWVRVWQDMEKVSKFMFNLLEELLVKKVKNFQWVMLMSHKSALQRTLTLLFSFFYKNGRQKLELLFSAEDHLLQLLKLAAYSLYGTVQNFVERNSGALLHKVVKSAYYLASQDQTRDKFLSKICVFTAKELSYVAHDQLNLLQEVSKDTVPGSIIETPQMRAVYRKYLKQLVDMQTTILVTGGKECGKSAMIRLFLDKHFNGQLVLRGSNDDSALREASKKLVGMGDAPQNQTLGRKLDYCIYVQDLSCASRLSKLQKYLQYIILNGTCIEGLHLRAAPTITAILQRRTISQQLQASLWNCFVVAFQTSKQYFDSVFSIYVTSKIQASFKSKGRRSLSVGAFEKLTQKYLKLVRYCSQNFKRGHRCWTYQFGIVTLKTVLTNFIERFNYEDLLSEQELSSRMNIEVLGRLLSRLQEQRQREKADDRINALFDGEQLRAMEERSLRENVLLNCNLDQESLANARIKHVVLTDSIRKFVPKLAIALRSANCVLINKANLPFNRSAASVAIEMLRLPVRQLHYCENWSKFLSQIQRANEITLKKSSLAYYYLSLQEILGNPQVVFFIGDYLAREASQLQGRELHSHHVKFVLEYSSQNHSLIAAFLSSSLLPHCYIMHYDDRGEDIAQIAGRLMQERTGSGGSSGRQMQGAVRVALRILDQLRVFEPPKHIATCMFSSLNASHMVLSLLNSYGLLLKRIQTKRNALELSLSQLNYMFKEYKERKAVFKQLQAEESSLLAIIGLAKDDHRRRSLEYNSIKNENLKQVIQKNQLQIGRLQREKEQLLSSEKIWSNIYRNAHAAISRTEFAQIKYMFLTNYSIQRELFEAIAFVLGEETDLPSLKRCFSDINIMARIKELRVPELPEGRLGQLQARIQAISRRDKLSCGRNMVQWMKVGCRLGLYRLQKDGAIRSLQARTRGLQEENRQIREKNRMDQMEKELIQLQKKIAQKSGDLNIVHLRITSIGSQLEELKKQFEELIDFEVFCLQQLQTLQENSKKLLNFCISQALHFTYVEMLAGQPRRKFKELINTKLRKAFGVVVTREQGEYFDVLRQMAEESSEGAWLIRPKEYLSSGKKRLVGELNSFLMNQSLPLVVVDRRSVLLQDTLKNNALYLRWDCLKSGGRERQLEKYSLLVIEMPSWAFSLQLGENQYEAHGKYRILRQGATRLALPGALPLIIIVGSHGEEELMGGYRVVDLEYSGEDYYQIVWNTVVRKRERRQQVLQRMVRTQKKLMEIVYFLCKKTQSITLKSKELIRTLTSMILQFNSQRERTRVPGLPYLPVDHSDGEVKLCRVLSKIIELMVSHFPSQEHTSFFFRDLLSTSFDYIEMQGVRDTQSIINLIMELLTEGFKDKFPFLYLYYIRIYAVEEGLATPIESLNLTALPDPRELVVDALRDADRDPSNFFKYLPFKNMQLQKTYAKLSRARVRSQAEVARLIQSQKGLSLFNRLILKRALAPKAFEVEIGRMIRDFEDRITLKNKMFLRRYVVRQRLFCVCDAGFWVSKLKFTEEFRLVQLSELPRKEVVPGRAETWAVFDDMQQGEQKTALLQSLVRMNSERVSVVLFSKEYLREDFREEFKFLPFQHLLNIFEIKELTKVSRSKYSHIFNKVIYFKTELLRRKPFNQRISFSFLFEKIREQIMNKEDYSTDEIVLHFQWDFFLWDSSFETNHLTLHQILSALDANPDLINEFVADDKLQDRINAVLARARFLRFDEGDICRLANQLRDSSARLDVRGGERRQTDIFYLQFQYKKQRLMREMEKIKRIAEIHLGRIEVTAQLVRELFSLLRLFDYDTFSDVLVKLIGWRKLQRSRGVLSIGLMRSEFNFYLLFENSIYIYYEMPAVEPDSLEEASSPQPHQSIDDLPSPTDTKSNHSREQPKQRTVPKRAGRLQTPQGESHMKQPKKGAKSVSLAKKVMSKPTGSSIVDPSSTVEANGKSDEQATQQFFKDCIYVIENRVVGLKKLALKQQKNLVGTATRTLDLPNNYSLRIIQLSKLLGSSKGESSRFKIVPKA